MWDLVLLLALAGVLRVHGLRHLSFSTDEASNALVAREYLETGRFAYPSGKAETGGILYPWVTAQSFRAGGEREWAARAPAAFLGILATVWLYLWGSHWFGPWAGRAAAVLFAVWPWTVTMGRVGRFHSLQQFLYVLMVIAAWKLLECNCLGHPLAEPPKISGRKAPLFTRSIRFVPLFSWVGLSLLATPSSALAILFLPVYLLVRLSWAKVRGGIEDSEFERSLRYVLSGLCAFLAASAGLLWLMPAMLKRGMELLSHPATPLYYGEFLYSRFGWIFVAGLVAGSAMALWRGRGGWLILSAAWTPILTQTLLVHFYRDRLLYFAFPFILLLVALPLGWAVERMAGFLNQSISLRRAPHWKEVLAAAILVLAGMSVIRNVFLEKRSTTAVVRGSPFLFDRDVADWRRMAAKIPKNAGGDTPIITSDAVLGAYYLPRIDFIYPFVEPTGESRHPLTGAPVLPDAPAMDRLLNVLGEAWIVGTRRKFDAASQTSESAELWNRIMGTQADLWQGELEVLVHWKTEKAL
jgi:4-amino-4-deoxy-L-arabinose transferase-like glycosyltransferase